MDCVIETFPSEKYVCFFTYIRGGIQTFLWISKVLDMFIILAFNTSTSSIFSTVVALVEVAVRFIVNLVKNGKVGLNNWHGQPSCVLRCYTVDTNYVYIRFIIIYTVL